MAFSQTAGIKNITDIFMDMAFPARCPVCGDAVPFIRRAALCGPEMPAAGKKYAYICPDCADRFDFIKEPFCRKCGRRLCLPASGHLCRICSATGYTFEECRALMEYDSLSGDVLSGIKYRGRKEHAVLFGIMLAERFGDWIRKINPDIIVPVPVHEERLIKRGYNQAEVMAVNAGGLLGIPVKTDILRRRKKTGALKELDNEGRLMALSRAFTADPAKLPEKNITVLIIDDIYTTGATMEACALALKKAGAGRIYALAAAAGRDIACK